VDANVEIPALRPEARQAAQRCADELRRHWPSLGPVWLFGSILGPGFRASSDIDLAVEGLPPCDLLAALAVAEACSPGIPVDLVRFEDLAPQWQERLRRRALLLP
jgi:predicted nucleotidyltransferase